MMRQGVLATIITVLAACGPSPATTEATVARGQDDPLLRPIAAAHAARWLGPQEPVRVHGNTYLVGFEGLTVGLVRTDDGLILIDGAVPQAVRHIEANIRRLGFRIEDVRYILVTEAHFDHAGGVAALARDSGAVVLAGPATVEELRRGRNDPDDPQTGDLVPFPAVSELRAVADGQTVTLGGVTVTAVATPGHTPGSTSWAWRSCDDDGVCADVVFAASLSPISAEGYRFSDPANRPVVESYRRAYDRLREIPCDLILSSHPQVTDGHVKLARLAQGRTPNPFIEAGACRAYAAAQEARLERRLADEAGD